ncbi:glycosyltransferase [[Clostridium] cellulosi]
MIPKTVHYIWFGGAPKPPLVNMCILSWKEKLPNYELIEWNESNLDLDRFARENRFFAECRKRHIWAYMSDYIRLRILYEHGGIYLDTDMQILKSLDTFLGNIAFAGQENSEGHVSCGILGCEPHHPVIKRMLDFYDKDIWSDRDCTIPAIFSKVLKEDNLAGSVKIYPPEYFYPYPYQSEFKPECITDNTYSIHWWSASWVGKLGPYIFLTTKHLSQPAKTFVAVKRIIGFYRRKLL